MLKLLYKRDNTHLSTYEKPKARININKIYSVPKIAIKSNNEQENIWNMWITIVIQLILTKWTEWNQILNMENKICKGKGGRPLRCPLS